MSFAGSFWKNYNKLILKKIAPRGAARLQPEQGRIVFILTTRCNFSCKHCFRNFQTVSDLPLDIAQKVIEGAKKFNFQKIALTGGEPFLYPHLKPLLRMIVDNQYLFSLVTNGLLFKDNTDVLEKYRKNIAFVAFSLESVDKIKNDLQRQAGSFDALTENFAICRKLKIPFLIVTALSRTNLDELFDLALYAKRKGAFALTLTTVLPCPRLEENLVLDARTRRNLAFSIKELSKMLRLPISIAADIYAPGSISLCAALLMREVAIDMNGDIVQCCELANYDSKFIRKHAVVTTLKDKSFGEGLKLLSFHLHQFICRRIDDFQHQTDPAGVDFNSCFYCVNKR